jgi:hypothetical protein
MTLARPAEHTERTLMKIEWKTLTVVVVAVINLGLRAQAPPGGTLISAPPPGACNFYSLQFPILPPLPSDPFPELPL